MSKHTPGTWRIEPSLRGFDVVANDWRVAVVSIESNARLIAVAPELDAYRQYIEDNLERIERGGWTPVCFDEFKESEECANCIRSKT